MFAEIKWMLRHQITALRQSVTAWCRDVLAWRRFWLSYKEYKRLAPPDKQPALDWLFPCIGDDVVETPIEPIYFYQDAWAFERIVQRSPSTHIDVGSHHKFVALLSKVVPVTMVDIRPLSLPLESLQFRRGSILDLPFEDNSVSSLSSLCVVEHIGLGRYGDPLDPHGTEKAIAELKRILAPGGHLCLSVPVSDENVVHFNAGRILAIRYVIQLLEPLQVVNQAYIVGSTLQNQYENRPWFATTALFELKKPQ
jgi:SAM-dependent methyltransferase